MENTNKMKILQNKCFITENQYPSEKLPDQNSIFYSIYYLGIVDFS